MTAIVYDALKRILASRSKPKIEPMVDGKAGFLFLDKNDKPKVALHWEKVFNRIVKKYNRIYKVQMPNVTPHIASTLQYYVHVHLEDVQKEMKKAHVL